jgi:opacity protein-like surface antigen
MRYFAVVGAGNAFNVKAKSDQVVAKVDGTRADGRPIVSNFEKLEGESIQDDIALYKASLIVGAGAEYTFSGNTAMMFGITYNNGFTNILDIEGAKAKAHYLELSLGVFF